MATDQVGVAIIGTGAIARRRYIPELLSNRRVRDVLLVGRTEHTTRKVCEEFGLDRFAWGDDAWESAVADPSVSAVIVCTPNVLHAPIAVRAAQHGKHVLVEKPMAVTLQEADSMIEAAEASGVVLMVGHHRRFQACYRLGKALVSSGIIGRPLSVRATLRQPGPKEWAPDSRWFYREPSLGGGVLLDLGIHMADVVIWFLEEKPLRVSAVVSRRGTPGETATCVAEFSSGATAVVDVAWGMSVPDKHLVVYGETGRLSVDEFEGVEVVLSHPTNTRTSFPVPKTPLNSAGQPDFGVVDHFVRCVLGMSKPDMNPKEARDALACVLQAEAAAQVSQQ